MRSRTSRALRTLLRDMCLGAMAFLILPVLALSLGSPHASWTISGAIAGEAMATRAIEVTAPSGPNADNAIIAVAQLRPAGPTLQTKRVLELAVLGLTFSLLVAFNLAFWRHLRRVSAVPRRLGRGQRP